MNQLGKDKYLVNLLHKVCKTAELEIQQWHSDIGSSGNVLKEPKKC